MATFYRTAAALICSVIVFIGFAELAPAASPDQAPNITPSQSRVWFLRQLVPGTAMHAPMIYANGTAVGIIAQGVAFYRDFDPGNYNFTIDNCTGSPRPLSLPLTPGNQLALQVLSDDFWGADCRAGENSYLSMAPASALGMLFAPLNYLGQR